jgi:hypothetical protein
MKLKTNQKALFDLSLLGLLFCTEDGGNTFPPKSDYEKPPRR